MECQNTTKNLKINKNKSIGEIIVVVEGESEEIKLLKYIFTKVLDYNYISLKRNKVMTNEFRSKTNPNSMVIVANTNSSNIKSIMEDQNYQDRLYNLLKTDYNRSLKSVPIYILWDRDKESNSKENVLKILNTFKNSMDNGEEMNGILLLSYPCVESYEISNFDKQLYRKTFSSSEEAKKLFKARRYSLTNITEKTLITAVGNMHRTMNNCDLKQYDTSDFHKINKKIFTIEEEKFNNKGYDALSLISIMLIDLGIIYSDDSIK